MRHPGCRVLAEFEDDSTATAVPSSTAHPVTSASVQRPPERPRPICHVPQGRMHPRPPATAPVTIKTAP